MAMSKYLDVFRFSVRDQTAYLPAFMARNLFFVVILFVFFSLWRVVFAESGVIAGFTIVQTLWYLTFTEAIELSRSSVLQTVQADVKDGTIAYDLTRPYSYVVFSLARGVGEAVAKLALVLVVGFVVATVFVGPLPGYFSALPFGVLGIFGGIVLNVLWHLVIALLAFWTEEVMPFHWILQKLVFILGGMFFPIEFFPDWLARIARVLPFAFSAYWPARTMVAFSFDGFLVAVVGQAIYIGVLLALALGIFALAKRRVHAHGG